MKFKKTNINPNGIKTNDCVIRALGLALNKEWDLVYWDLCNIGFKLKAMPNDKIVYEEYLKNYKSVFKKVKKGEKRIYVNNLSNKGTYILSQANHLSILKNGVVLDLFDSRKKCIYKYWIIKENE